MFTVYTKAGCPQCDRAKQLLTTKQREFNSVQIGVDIELDEFRKTYPQVRAVPFIVSESGPIGGFSELAKVLNEA